VGGSGYGDNTEQAKLQELVDITHKIGQFYKIKTRGTGLRILPHTSRGRNDKIIKGIKFMKRFP